MTLSARHHITSSHTRTKVSERKSNSPLDRSGSIKADSFSSTVPVRKLGYNPPLKTESPEHDFDLLDEIGSGGMGIIFSAYQRSIDRQIAIKVINPQLCHDNSSKSAFLKEAIITGNLDHPNILSIHDLGRCPDGNLFYVMKKVEGTSWDKVIKHKSEQENLDILLKVCDAIAYAHSKGVIHRDLKPANIMLGNFGEVLVMDWGLAASIGSHYDLSNKAETITDNSDIVGTPAYMSPEMLDDDTTKIGPRSDVYLLGGILFEILTGKKPHSRSNIHPLYNVRHNILQPTSVTGELLNIALKALSTNPEDRYNSVKLMQRELRRYQKHRESIRLMEKADVNFFEAEFSGNYSKYSEALFGYREALKLWTENDELSRNISKTTMAYAVCAQQKGDYKLALSLLDKTSPEARALITTLKSQLAKRNRKNKMVKYLSFSFVSLLAVIVLILSVSYILIHQERLQAIAAKNKAEAAEAKANLLLSRQEQENYYNQISLTIDRIKQAELLQAQKVLSKAQPVYRGWEWYMLKKIIAPPMTQLKGHTDSITTIELLPNQNKVITGSNDTTLKVWDIKAKKCLKTLQNAQPVTAMAYSLPSNLICVNGSNGNINVWSTAPYKHLFTLTGHQAAISSLATHPTQPLLYSASYDHSLKIWNLQTGRLIKSIPTNDIAPTALTLSPNGLYLAWGSSNGSITCYDLTEEQTIYTLHNNNQYINSLTFNISSTILAAGDGNGKIVIWDLTSSQQVGLIHAADAAVNNLIFDTSNHLLVTQGKKAVLYNIKNNHRLKTIELNTKAAIYCTAYNTTNNQILTGDSKNMLHIWHAANRIHGHPTQQPSTQSKIQKTPDRLFQFKMNQHNLQLYNPAGQTTYTLSGHKAQINQTAYNPTNHTLTTCSDDTTTKIWHLPTGTLLRTLQGHKKYVRTCNFSDDYKYLITGSWDHTAKIWDSNSGQLIQTLSGHKAAVTCAKLSANGKYAVTGSSDNSAIIWDLTSPSLRFIRLEGHNKQINDILFTPDNKRLVTLSADRSISFWDISNGRQVFTIPLTKTPLQGTFGNQGKTLRIKAADNSVLTWQTAPIQPAKPVLKTSS